MTILTTLYITRVPEGKSKIQNSLKIFKAADADDSYLDEIALITIENHLERRNISDIKKPRTRIICTESFLRI